MSHETTAGRRPMVELRGVSKRYGEVFALSSVDLAVRKGEFVTLLGPSSSGKTTLLNLIAGTSPPSSGRIMIDGRDATALPPSQRGLGMVFQNYALMPHMTVFENIAFPLRVRRMAKAEIAHKVNEVLKLIHLPDIAARKPRELSGGQQQRVALARCIVYNQSLILLDAPLGALDKKLREQMQLEIKRIHAELGITMLNVTHDQDEALTMSDRSVLMNAGRVEQQCGPEELYFKPCSVFAAGFIGDANLFEATVARVDAKTVSLACKEAEAVSGKPAFGMRPGAMIMDFSSRPPVASLTPNSPSHLANYRRVYAASESLVDHESGEGALQKYLATYDALDARAVVLKGRDLETTFGMKIANEDVAQFCRAHGERCIGFAGVDPNKGMAAVRDLEFAVRELGLRGLNLQCFE